MSERERYYSPLEIQEVGVNGFDFLDIRHAPGSEYEIHCFQTFAENPQNGTNTNTLLLGPGIVNYLFGQPFTAGFVRPDMMTITPSKKEKGWKISSLYECKKAKKKKCYKENRRFWSAITKTKS